MYVFIIFIQLIFFFFIIFYFYLGPGKRGPYVFIIFTNIIVYVSGEQPFAPTLFYLYFFLSPFPFFLFPFSLIYSPHLSPY